MRGAWKSAHAFGCSVGKRGVPEAEWVREHLLAAKGQQVLVPEYLYGCSDWPL